MSRRNYRKRRVSEEGDDSSEIHSTTDLLEERKEIQKFRKRPKGVSAVGLALGKELPPEESVISDPFKLKTGGLVQMNDLIQDRDRDRDDEGTGMSVNIGANFAAETNRRDEDTMMLKYIEEEMTKRKGADRNEQEDPTNKLKTKEDILYEVPKNIDVRSKLMKSEEMLSNQMLSGIPEVDLGISAKIRNIEATEEAKMRVLEEQRSKKKTGPTEMVPTNMASNFMLHSRFFDEQRSVDAESQKAAKQKAKEEEKKKKVVEPTVPAMESSGADFSSTQNKAKKKEKSSDDFYYEKFKKRARDNWRYQ
ncbi:telomere length and silencing protein 1 homolog [Exaiptasia diaphana]|uniref:Telomere length and silencing protein 1 homolog n=1 Tax=Exaiptasia diaphana TaxID=2652724 RepID=A0A913Y4Q8_EXADI|nr:telomere length and silencing protein 1 homolog [Exaiptasia diaphana]KXJ19667.1 Uncharacterized protein C9orf78 [Exaiptasia diaphana]